MSCNCNKAINSTACIENFTIGSLDEDVEDYRAVFKSASGRIDIYPLSAIVYTTLVYVEEPAVRIGETYEIWLNKSDEPIEKKTPFIIGEGSTQTEVDCVSIEFVPCYNAGDEQLSEDVTLTLE